MYDVVVYMSTYNGEKYLKDQIDSILKQKGVNVHLIIRDDGSTDNTINIICNYCKKYKNIKLIKGENIGFVLSFLSIATTKNNNKNFYYAFSDQDDIWDEDKLISGIMTLEKEKDEIPLLYYCAQRVVDENGIFKRIDNTKMLYSKYSALLVPMARGCTMIWNQSMSNLLSIYTVDEKSKLKISAHDTWLALLSFWMGKLVYDNTPHMSYRQTSTNTIGTYKNKLHRIPYVLKRIYKYLFCTKQIRENNAKELLRGYGHLLEDVQGVEKIAHYRNCFINRVHLIFDKKYFQGISLKWNIFLKLQILLGII